MFNNEYPYGFDGITDHSRRPYYNDESDYNTNSPSYYDDLSRKQKLIQYLAEKIAMYDKELEKRFKEWDKNLEELPDDLKRMFLEWVDDGTLARILAQLMLEEYATKKDVAEMLKVLKNEIDIDMNTMKKEIDSNILSVSDRKQNKNNDFKKSVVADLPLRFPDYEGIIYQHDLKNVYPSAFTIDEELNTLYMVSLGALKDGGVLEERIITMYDLNNKGNYIGYFYAGVFGGESIVFKKEYDRKYLYLQNGLGIIGKFDITVKPSNADKLKSVKDIYTNVHWTFGHDGTNWLITQDGSEIGYYDQRSTHAIYDKDFNRTGFIMTNPADLGYFNTPYYDDNTKIQSLALGNSRIYVGLGAYHRNSSSLERGRIGFKVLDSSGRVIDSYIQDSQRTINTLRKNGYDAELVENEGIYVNKKGEILTLTVYKHPDESENTRTTGVLILKEMSNDREVIDFTPCASNLKGTVISNHHPMSLKDDKGKSFIENHLTGEKLTTMIDIMKYMKYTYRNEFSFYSNSVEVKWFDDIVIPGSRYVTINNFNNRYFHVNVTGYKDRAEKKYFIDMDITTDKVSTIIDIPTGVFFSEYVNGTDIFNLPRGYYEMTLNKTVTELPETFPSENTLCFVTVKGSTSRKTIEIHAVKSNQYFIGGMADKEKIKFKEL